MLAVIPEPVIQIPDSNIPEVTPVTVNEVPLIEPVTFAVEAAPIETKSVVPNEAIR